MANAAISNSQRFEIAARQRIATEIVAKSVERRAEIPTKIALNRITAVSNLRIIIRGGTTRGGGYGFGYVSDMYPSPFWYVSDSIFDIEKYRERPLKRAPNTALLTFSLLIRENIWVFLSFLSNRSIFDTFVGGSKTPVIAEKREENPEILIN